MYILFGVLSLVFAYVMTALIYRKIELGKLLIVGTGLFISMYIIVSGLLIWIDKFSIMRGECFTLLAEIIVIIILFMMGRKIPRIYPAFKKYFPLLAVLIVAVFISSSQKAGLYNTEQDEGLYQMKAMLYMGGYNSNILSFEEYENIDNGAEKNVYFTKMSEMTGLYEVSNENMQPGDLPGYEVHGIATFAALLALWGKMFGLASMTGVLTLCYVLTIGLAWIICDNFKLDKILSLAIAVLTAVCPIILWSSMNILTEILLTMLFTCYIAMVTDNFKKKIYNWSVIPVIAYCYTHVTAIGLLPLFILTYLYLFWAAGKKSSLVSVVLTTVGYVTGLRMMYVSSEVYTSDKFVFIFNKTGNHINDNNIVLIMMIILGIFDAILIAFEFFGINSKIRKSFKHMKKKSKNIKMFKVVTCILVLVLLVLFTFIAFKSVKGGNDLSKVSSLCFVIMTGYLMFPIALIGMILNSTKIFKESRRMIIMGTLVYTLIAYAAVLYKDIYYYYYYARYYAMFMIPVLVMAALILNYFRPIYYLPVVLIAGVLLVVNNSILYNERDLTYGDFTIVNSIASCVDQQDAVILMDDAYAINKMFMVPVKAMTGADIYFLNEDYSAQIQRIKSQYEDVFVLGYNTSFDEAEDSIWKKVYEGTLHTSIYEGHGSEDESITIPKKADKFDSPLALYILK